MNEPSANLEAFADCLLNDLVRKFPHCQPASPGMEGAPGSAGIAYYRENRIALSKNLLTDEERVRSTLVHEYAHLLAYHRHGRKAANHGPYWHEEVHYSGRRTAAGVSLEMWAVNPSPCSHSEWRRTRSSNQDTPRNELLTRICERITERGTLMAPLLI